ncbi:hypothetical protein B0A48_07069 [Cryoendolithus antarcticus]|uniref:Uncharacterized protein n=1 Tax=Cryoendolithus antarcticus TaxID=1507870 RepID=A0A1V8T874_9PEZI|nr:hypothetical protein B0A48_07069 [Cryoendolithus antarcticus]
MVDAVPASSPTFDSVLLSALKGVATGLFWLVIILLVSYRTVLTAKRASLWDAGMVCAVISMFFSLILTIAVTDQPSLHHMPLLQQIPILWKSLPASTLIVIALNSAVFGLVAVVVAICSAISAKRVRRAAGNGGGDDAIEVASFIDKEDESEGVHVSGHESDHDAAETLEKTFPSTFAGFREYFACEMRQPTRFFEERKPDPKNVPAVASSMQHRMA